MPEAHPLAPGPTETPRPLDTGPAPSAPAGLPESVGRYRILGRVGSGAFACVYRAHDPQLDREVALKVPHPTALDSATTRQRFLREARAAAGLRHPHIVPVFEFNAEPPGPYLAEGFVRGRTLAALLTEQGPLPPRQAARIAQALAEALAYAHGEGVVHRDVKPANVLLDDKGEPHLADFGLAFRKEGGERLTQEGALLGTPEYLAPEAVTDAGPPSEAADQYALGVILFEVLTGQLPFSGPPEAVLYRAVHEQVPRPGKLRSGLPRDLETICLKATARRTPDRYGGCGELAEDLRRFLGGEPVKARRLGPVGRLWRWARRSPATAALTAAVALLLVLGTVSASLLAAWALGEARAAEREKARADVFSSQASHRLYVSDMRLAQQAWEDGRVGRLLELLEGQRPVQTNGIDLRGFEWHYWWRQTHKELVRVSQPEDTFKFLAFSRDGTRFAASTEEGQVRICETQTGRILFTLGNKGSEPQFQCGAFSADGLRFVGGSSGGLALWDVESGRELRGPQKKESQVDWVDFTPDEQHLTSANLCGHIKVWDVSSGKVLSTFEAPEWVSWAASSPDGRRLVGVSKEGSVLAWDLGSGRRLYQIKEKDQVFTAAAFSPDGSRLAGGSEEGTVKVWDAGSGRESLLVNRHGPEIRCVAFSPDGRHLAGADLNGTIKVWEASTGRELAACKGHTESVFLVTFRPDGRLLSASEDGAVKVWDAEPQTESIVLGRHDEEVASVAFDPEGRRLVSAARDGFIRIWEVPAGKRLLNLEAGAGGASRAAFSPDGRCVVGVLDSGPVKIWDVGSGRDLHTFRVPEDKQGASCGSFSPDGRQLIAGSLNGPVKIWAVSDEQEVFRFKVGIGLGDVCPSPDRRYLAGTFLDGPVKIWDAGSGAEVFSLSRQKEGSTKVAFSPDGGRLASANTDGTVVIWDAATGAELLTLRGHTRWATWVAFSPDGRRLASASQDSTVKVWDVESGAELLTLRGHLRFVNGVAFSPDGRLLASAGSDGTIRLWDARSGQE